MGMAGRRQRRGSSVIVCINIQYSCPWLSMSVPPNSDSAATDYLSDLNPAQRAAAEFGAGQPDAPALLDIAGAGAGTTSTLAHRVEHLIQMGQPPCRERVGQYVWI